MNRLYKVLKLLVHLTITYFIISSFYVVIRYITKPEAYIYYSAPWYTGILINGIISGIIVIILLVIMIIIKKKVTIK